MSDLFHGFAPTAGATLSPCRKWRYELWRGWGEGWRKRPFALFIGLNPSTADETTDDPTIRRCVAFAKAWGYSSMRMANLFAWRATDPKAMMAAADPVGPDNNKTLKRLANDAGVIIAAWGKHGSFIRRDEGVCGLLAPTGLSCLSVNKDGSPSHPLYLPKTAKPVPY